MKIAFGLIKQGHVPTVGKMLAEGKSWEEIGKAIGWCPKTAKQHWLRYVIGPTNICMPSPYLYHIEIAKVLMGQYRIMDDMCHPCPTQWRQVELIDEIVSVLNKNL